MKRPLPPFIQKRRKRYYAVLEIPLSLRHHYPAHDRLGKPTGRNLVRLVRSLETDSLETARRRVSSVVGAWRSEFARLKNEGDDAAFYRRRLQKAKTDAEKQQIMAEIDLATESIGLAYADNPSSAEIAAIDQLSHESRADFHKRATAQIVGMTDFVDAYLERRDTTDKTKAMAKADIAAFASSFPTVQDVSYDGVQRWVDALGLAPATVRRTLSSLRGYWKYLQRPDVKAVAKDFQPFAALDLPTAKTDPRDKRKPFTAKDVIRLVMTSLDDPELNNLIRIAQWTGCRREEICSLRTKSVHLKADIPYLEIEDAKTSAGWRQIPIHKALFKSMAQLVKESVDGYVLSGLSSNKYEDRGDAVGKRFSRLKTSLGYGKQYVFHSIRNTVVTLLENAGVAENVVADIVGHEKPRITYGLYSGGTSLAMKEKALARLSYTERGG